MSNAKNDSLSNYRTETTPSPVVYIVHTNKTIICPQPSAQESLFNNRTNL